MRPREHSVAPMALCGHSADRIELLSKADIISHENVPSARSYVAVFGGYLWPHGVVSI